MTVTMEKALMALVPDALYSWDGSRESLDYGKLDWHGGNSKKKPTETALKNKQAELQAAFPMQELRDRRNALLAASDWTGLVDSALTSEVSAQWKLYRQRLRDLPSGLDTPAKVKNAPWPIKPV